ncbi:MAG: hypothetical protein IMW89_13290 [Ktedonobacteraceae bacterium]|nr:hypothetical protein [Ktedonobacteraceae bacterium]
MPEATKSHTDVQYQDEGEIFEIFQQKMRKDTAPRHGGNLRAPDSELALHYAREFYGRREESDRLWVVPRAMLWEISDPTQPVPHALTGAMVPQQDIQTTFAVFGRAQAGAPLAWILDLPETTLSGAVEAAAQLAQQSVPPYRRLWLCPRSAILELADSDLLHPPLDRSYRRLAGYNIREKLRTARQHGQPSLQGSEEKDDDEA